MPCTPEIREWLTGALVAVSTGFGGVHSWSSPPLGFDGAYSLELSEGVCCPSRPRCELANRTCRCERPGSARWFAGAHLGFGRPVCAWSSHVIRWSPVAQAPPPLSLPVLFGGAGSLEPTLRFGEAAGALSVVRWAIRWSRSSRPGVVELVIGAHSVFWRGGWGSV